MALTGLRKGYSETDTHIYFYGSYLSQWTPYNIEIDGVGYNCCEQYMMAEKARMFGDSNTATKIMNTSNPSTQKRLGREIFPFLSSVWDWVGRGIVFKANMAKFTQHKELKSALISTNPKKLVEASPTDSVWGVGLGITNPAILDESNWNGENLLGRTIMKVRDVLVCLYDN